jgi:ATP-binding cassette subfamily F protein uup
VNAVVVPEGEGRWTEYAGGYTDMLAQRGADLTGKPPAMKGGPSVGKSREPVRDNKGGPRRKLSFHEKHALEALPGRIGTLQAQIRELQKRLEDPDFYARDRAAFMQTATALEAAQSELSVAEQQWLDLEIRREEIEGD